MEPPQLCLDLAYSVSLHLDFLGNKPQIRELWLKNYQASPGNITVAYMGAPSLGSFNVQVDAENRVFFMANKENMHWYGYNLDSGNELWGPVCEFNSFQYYGAVLNPPAPGYVYEGVLYVGGYGGVINAIESRSDNIL